MAKRIEWINNKRRNFESSISEVISKTINPILDKGGKVESDIIINWHKIFDKSLSSKAGFKKLSFTNRKENKFVLYINVKPQDFLEISYATPIMIEQLSVYLGYKGCEKIMISKSP